MTQAMRVTLTQEAPAAHWGKADITFEGNLARIHLQGSDALRQIQMAARKLRSQGIASAALEGEGWDLNRQWVFAQGFVTAKAGWDISWTGDEATDRKSVV